MEALKIAANGWQRNGANCRRSQVGKLSGPGALNIFIWVSRYSTCRLYHIICAIVRERRSLDILSVKKEARLSARALAEVKVGKGEKKLRCNSLFMVCQRRRRLSEDEETRLE